MNTLPDSLVRFEHDFEEAIRKDVRGARRRPRRAVVLRVSAAGVAAVAVALGILSALPGGGPSAVQRAAAALAVEGGAILHVDVTVRQTSPDGQVSTWEDDSWQQQSAPFDRRDVETSSSAPRVERSVSGGVAHVYDPATNTIYTAPVEVPLGPRAKALVPMLSKIAAQLAGTATRIERPSVASSADVFRTGLVALLRSGAVVEQGRATVDGREARVFRSPDGSLTYLADADSYRPIRFSIANGGAGLTIVFRAFEQIRGDGAAGLLSLRAQHPGARVDTRPSAYAAALPRLYPHG